MTAAQSEGTSCTKIYSHFHRALASFSNMAAPGPRLGPCSSTQPGCRCPFILPVGSCVAVKSVRVSCGGMIPQSRHTTEAKPREYTHRYLEARGAPPPLEQVHLYRPSRPGKSIRPLSGGQELEEVRYKDGNMAPIHESNCHEDAENPIQQDLSRALHSHLYTIRSNSAPKGR